MGEYFKNVKKVQKAPPKETIIDASGLKAAKGSGKGVFNKADKVDRIINLERENNTLKEKGNLLGLEVHKMQTKLRRINELMNKRHRHAHTEEGAYSVMDMETDLKGEIDNLADRNSE